MKFTFWFPSLINIFIPSFPTINVAQKYDSYSFITQILYYLKNASMIMEFYKIYNKSNYRLWTNYTKITKPWIHFTKCCNSKKVHLRWTNTTPRHHARNKKPLSVVVWQNTATNIQILITQFNLKLYALQLKTVPITRHLCRLSNINAD